VIEVGARIAGRGLRGEQGVGREVRGFLLLGTELVDDPSTLLWIYVLWGSLGLRSGDSGLRLLLKW
jgi:hypothetical protein